jgi:hypothetical protein
VIWRAPEASSPRELTSVLAQFSVSAVWPLPWMHTPPTSMRCTGHGLRLYFCVCLRYRDGEARRAERHASTSQPVRTKMR